MQAESFLSAAARHAKPLVIRGGLARTFGSLVGFLALLFLLLGFYLLGDAFEHPLSAQDAGVLAAAFSITLAAILLYYLLKPRHAQRMRASRFRRAG
jgi:hypothetical protein